MRSPPFALDASINYVAEQFEREAFNAATTEVHLHTTMFYFITIIIVILHSAK